MSQTISVECATADAANHLRQALRNVHGVDVEDALFAKGGPFDARTLVGFTVAVGVSAASVAAVIHELSAHGYSEIKINGKVVALSLITLEGALQAKKPEGADASKCNPRAATENQSQKKR